MNHSHPALDCGSHLGYDSRTGLSIEARIRGCNSVGRVTASQAVCQGFESLHPLCKERNPNSTVRLPASALRSYAHVIHVAPGAEHKTVAAALASIDDASSKNRYAILVAAGTYKESRIQMKPWVDLYGGYAPGDWETRDVYQHAAILDAEKKGPVVIGADDARLDGFVITGGQQQAHGGVIVMCSAPINNDAGGIWVEGDSMPLITGPMRNCPQVPREARAIESARLRGHSVRRTDDSVAFPKNSLAGLGIVDPNYREMGRRSPLSNA